MVVVSHLFLFLRKSFRGRFDLYESNLPLFGNIYFPIAPFCILGRTKVYKNFINVYRCFGVFNKVA